MGIRGFWAIHRLLRKAQARYRRSRGLEPTQLPGDPPETETGGEIVKLTNMKTSAVGILGGLLGISTAGWLKEDGTVNWPAIAIGVAIAVLGVMAKDHNATGGTVAVTAEAKDRVAK